MLLWRESQCETGEGRQSAGKKKCEKVADSIFSSGLNTGPAVPPRLYGLFVLKPDRCYEGGGDFYRMRSLVSGSEFNSPTLQTDDFRGLVLQSAGHSNNDWEPAKCQNSIILGKGFKTDPVVTRFQHHMFKTIRHCQWSELVLLISLLTPSSRHLTRGLTPPRPVHSVLQESQRYSVQSDPSFVVRVVSSGAHSVCYSYRCIQSITLVLL